MPNPTLVLVAQSQSKVRFLSSDDNSVVLRVLREDGLWAEFDSVSTHEEVVDLKPGTYVAVSKFPYLLGCQVLDGLVTVIQPHGGEDPWPVPPKLSPVDEEILRIEAAASEEEAEFVAAGQADGGEDPFPVPTRKPPSAGSPLPLLKGALRDAIHYARSLPSQ